MKKVGKRIWIIPDCELPSPGGGPIKGHESMVIVNDCKQKAVITVELYFTDRYLSDKIVWEVEGKRVRCFRLGDPNDMCNVEIPYDTQYAVKLKSNVPIVVQYGRLDDRQSNMAFYTTMGYSEV